MNFSWPDFWNFLGFIWGVLAVAGLSGVTSFVAGEVASRRFSDSVAQFVCVVGFVMGIGFYGAVFIGLLKGMP